MRLRRLTICNFRGIRHCEWRIDQALVALVGPGDATKTTLLDAVGAVLHPNYTLPLSDADFYRGDITSPITIEVVISGMPPELLTESQLGPDCAGLTAEDELIHDPIDAAEPCLVIRSSVGEDLEPSWMVVRPGGEGAEDTRPISASQRRALGFFRLGERANTHLRWSRVSALSSFTANKAGEQAVLAAQRSAREAVFDHESPDLAGVTAEVAKAAMDYGSAHFSGLRPGLEPDSATSANALILHDDRVPLTGYGLGSRRLTSLAIQTRAVPGSAVIAVDEIELGLEPHRLAHLLQKLSRQASDESVQVMFTTHSPVVVEALRVADLVVVRSVEGTTTVAAVPQALDEAQGAVRAAPSALLGRRVGVGEGATEVGMLRGLLRILDPRRSAEGLDTSAVTGFVVSNGNGNMACPRAARFASLGYPSLALIDNDDRSVDSDVAPAGNAGAQVLRWDHGMAIEHQLAHDLDLAGLQELVNLASLLNDIDAIALRDSVQSRLNTAVALPGHTVGQWAHAAAGGLAEIRVVIGQTAHKKGWFKREDHGEVLAGLIDGLWDALAGTTTGSVLSAVVRFVYDDPDADFLRPDPTP